MKSGYVLVFLFACASLAHAQWLPDAQQKRLRALWDQTGVDFPEGGKFYSVPRVSQRLVTVNSVECNGIYDDKYRGFPESGENINQQLPWKTPAGLHWSPADQWTKATLAYFPGEILVWREYTQVLNLFGSHQPQPRISWRFPEGTVFCEMLIRRHKGKEWVFEIRERIRGKQRWHGGTTFRPWNDKSKMPPAKKKQDMKVPPGKLSDFGVDWKKVTAWELPEGAGPLRLMASTLVPTATHDDGFVPKGYLGNTMKCAVCHRHSGESTSYGATNVPGSDSVITWHPFTMATLNTDRHPQFDERWPLRHYRGR